jgi:beta-alanine--pyruvate transaminase
MSATRQFDRAELESFWMPFTANRQFKANPRLLARAQGMHYWTTDGRQILDGVAGLWCVNAGHGRREITEAVSRQIAEMDYAPPFQMGHPGAFELANRVVDWLPEGLNHVFFTNSGISVGGMVNNRKWFGSQLPGVDHLPHTHDLAHNAYSRGEPEWGAHLADELERIVALHDASTIAAVIVEPVAGSTGVLLPPKGYLGRLREICSRHGILLIFDEVITGFGRLGAPFAADYFGVVPDMITMAKGLTNGAVPMGAVAARSDIYQAFMQGPDNAIELFHGYTYSAHPVACAAGNATQEIYRRDGLLTRAAELADYWADAVHSLKGLPHVIDLRNLGLIGAVELEPIQGRPGARAFDAFLRAFEKGILIRVTGDIIALSPPLIIERPQVDELFGRLADVLRETP